MQKQFLTRRFERDPCRVHVVLPPVDVLHGLDGGLAPPAHLHLVGGGVVGVAPRDQPQRAEAGEEKQVRQFAANRSQKYKTQKK